MPDALSSHFSARLQAYRPPPCAAEPDGAAAEQADGAIQPDALSPAPSQLQSKLASITVQMPMLRSCPCPQFRLHVSDETLYGMAGLGKPGMYIAGSGFQTKGIHSLHAHPTRALAAPRVV